MTISEKATQMGKMMTTESVDFGLDGADSEETGGGNEAIVDIEAETSSVSGTDLILSSGWGERDIWVRLEEENQGCVQSRRSKTEYVVETVASDAVVFEIHRSSRLEFIRYIIFVPPSSFTSFPGLLDL
jgi:hypothetical protein